MMNGLRKPIGLNTLAVTLSKDLLVGSNELTYSTKSLSSKQKQSVALFQ